MHGDLLKQQNVDAIVNTVNCVGVMGKGIALQFKNKWPANYAAYKAACNSGRVQTGRMFVFDSGGLVKPHYIINFPTKKDWREKSKIEYIRDGLVDLIEQVRRLNIRSIAIPPLGCGNGGLNWAIVRGLIEGAFSELPHIEAHLFSPSGAPDPKTMEVRTNRPKMTEGRAAILKVLDTYRALGYGLSKIEVQKLAYFLQEAGEQLRLSFVQHQYGPYSDELRHALQKMEGHFIRGLGDGVVEAEIEPDPKALADAEAFTVAHGNAELDARVCRVGELIEGFQSPYGMELLATVHWVATHGKATSLSAAVSQVQNWNDRKRRVMKKEHVEAAWNRLHDQQWLSLEATNQRQA
jgi:O-acetyl-ADP-ribose deacetylase (regulator of RNase III)